MKVLKKVFEKSLLLHQWIANKFGYSVRLIQPNSIITQRMEIDRVDSSSFIDNYSDRIDYTRYRTLELVAGELKKKYGNELSKYCVAEAGVNAGSFAEAISVEFSCCKLYLYDTFTGFDSNDMKFEMDNSYTHTHYLEEIDSRFKAEGEHFLIKKVLERVKNPDKTIVRKGYFPDTIEEEREEKFVFVSLDMDIYKPMYEGIIFFYPRLVKGGVIFVHDYNNVEYKGVRKALEDAECQLGEIPCIPMSDKCGTVILLKL